ncbi:MAG: septum formation family protein [Actinomycetota bacterium]|nr:septum formation family protein [Actinomycetota bacterium]MED5362220.1 septum formation family protein [Actinomycetota bacterium]MEE3256025.1 septum formation family protein [Actinomycetota bacterium]
MKFLFCLLFLLLVGTGCDTSEELSLVDDSVRGPSGDIEVGGRVGVLRLTPGDCFLLGPDEIEAVDAVPCEHGHVAEVFAVFDLAESDWPGAAAVAQIAKSGCLDRFRNATGHKFDPVHMAITGYAPNEHSWSDDRRVLCVVTAHDLSFVKGRVTR